MEEGEVIVMNDRCYPMTGYLKDYSEYCLLEEGKEDDDETIVDEHEETKTFDLMAHWKNSSFFRTDYMGYTDEFIDF